MATWRDNIQIPGVTIPTGDAMTGKLNKEQLNDQTRFIKQNPLHRFASYTTVFTLSALDKSDLENPEQILTGRPHDIIARTGGIGNTNTFSNFNNVYGADKMNNPDSGNVAEEVARVDRILDTEALQNANKVLRSNEDLYFHRVVIDSYPRPNPDRGLMNFTKIEMELHEPMGISLWEKCRAAAANSGYTNHYQAPYLLTVEFKGFDENGTSMSSGPGLAKRFYPIRMSTSNMKLNSGGAIYTVEAQPWTEFGMVNSYLYFRATASVSSVRGNIDSYLESLEKEVTTQQQKEVNANLREYEDKYLFTIDPAVIAQGLKNDDKASNNANATRFGSGGRVNVTQMVFRPKVSIAKALEDIIKQLPGYRKIDKIIDNYWKEVGDAYTNLPQDFALTNWPSEYVPWFKIVTSVIPDSTRFDQRLKSHPVTVLYHVVPYRIHILNFLRVGMAGLSSWGKYVRKVYNYIYTGQNLDIMDLEIEYNNSYYNSILALRDKSGNLAKKDITIMDRIRSFFGIRATFPEPNLPLSAFPSTFQSTTNSNIPKEDQAQVQEFYDYLTNPKGDMVNVNMRVMGDSHLLGQDYALPLKQPPKSGIWQDARVGKLKGLDFDSEVGAFNFDNAEVVVQLNFRFPTDFMSNGMYDFTSEATPQFTGLYRINRVESVFDGGQFYQNLEMTRFNNQTGGKGSDPIAKYYEDKEKEQKSEAQIKKIFPKFTKEDIEKMKQGRR